MRLFVAADLDAALRRRLGGIQQALRDIPLPVRWVRPEGIHVTFKFLGEAGAGGRPAIEAALERAAARAAPFRLHTGGLGSFPDRGQPRVLWIGLGGDLAAAAKLHAALESEFAPLGFPIEERTFRPHLTLGRVKGAPHGDWRPALSACPADGLGEIAVGECVLFESRHDRDGATYVPLRRCALPARAEGA
ncbi:MAG: RNA 2',3'-cyclic phosphodiesterase [Candidatus Polarisedimenticolia bacterium]